ncbi:MAG: tetratricopeptide repeat protein [Pseudanabaena sp.]|jgi:tetratricopeptide (TPR) repeat protein
MNDTIKTPAVKAPIKSNESPETYLQAGDRYRASGNIPLALNNYQRALSINPDFAPAHERFGTMYQQQGNLMEAIASFSRAVANDPQLLDAQIGLGNAYQQKGWIELAIIHFQKALELAPDRFIGEYHCKLGDSLKERGRIPEAIASYERAIATNPNDINGYRAIVQIYLEQNDPESVNQLFERINAYNSELLESMDYNALGVVWLQKRKSAPEQPPTDEAESLEQAIACFEKAIQINPAYAKAHCNLGNAFIRKDQIKDAIISYKEAIDIEPNFPQPYFNLGIVLNNIGKLDESISCFQSAIELVPNWTEAHQYLGTVLQRVAVK